MSGNLVNLQNHLESSLAGKIEASDISLNELTLEVVPENILEVANFLKTDELASFDQLIDVCGVDYLSYGQSEWDIGGGSFTRGVKREFSFDSSDDDEQEIQFEGKRFAVVTHLLSVKNNQRIRIKSYCEDNDFPVMESIESIWNSANWFEREAFDLFGILFNNHPDLRRILTDYGFIGHPFRKDFPLIGQVDMRYDEEQERVIYEPVSIEERTLVPRVIRDNQRFKAASEGDE